jgi:ABC-type nitrate/sulfonate/bicarbonate transport system substrate-binding protein
MKNQKGLSLLFLFLLLALPVACRPAATNPEQLTFMAGFKAQANLPFVGAYVAQEKGFFADEGLDVTIRHSAGGGEHLQLLVADEVQVTTQDAAVLLKRRADPGLPLVSLALIGQRGQQAYVALAQSGIATPQQWVGHKVGYKGTPPPDLFAILDAAGLAEDDVSLVNVGFDPRVLTEGLVDVYPVYKSNEPYLLRSWGYEPVLWDAADYGVPTLGLTYVATEEMVATRPEVLRHFIHAAMRGIAYAADHREEAVDIVLQYAEGADRAHMRFMLDAELLDFVSPVTDAHEPGWQTREQWAALQDILLQYEAMDAPVDVDKAFTNQFLPGQE